MNHRLKTFTLLEILVAIGIMGTLFALAFTYAKGSRMKARDVQRKTDLQLVSVGMLEYKQSHTRYPVVQQGGFGSYAWAACRTTTISGLGGTAEAWVSLVADVAPYLKLPLDPTNRNQCQGVEAFYHNSDLSGHQYVYMANKNHNDPVTGQPMPIGTRYSFWAALENPRDPYRNGTSNMSGLYSNRFFYYVVYRSYLGDPTRINLPNVYVVGCRLQGITTDYEDEFTHVCDQ